MHSSRTDICSTGAGVFPHYFDGWWAQRWGADDIDDPDECSQLVPESDEEFDQDPGGFDAI